MPAAEIAPGPQLWKAFGLPNDPSIRDQILVMTIVRVGQLGPTAFSPKALARELGVSQATINYHFNSREELLATAAVRGYGNYVESVWRDVSSVSREPVARLRKWLEASIDIMVSMQGWGPILNYPTTSLEVSAILEDKFKSTMTNYAELHMARLAMLVADVRRNKVSETEYELGNLPRLKLLRDVRTAVTAASIGWSSLGFAVWKAGRHLPTNRIAEALDFEERARNAHIDRLIKIAQGE